MTKKASAGVITKKFKKKVYLHFPDLTYKILFLAQNYSPLILNNRHREQGAT